MLHERHGAAPTRQPLVRLAGTQVNAGGSIALKDIYFSLQPGAHWAVAGGNGAGKTSLLRLIRGDVWPVDVATRSYCMAGGCHHDPITFRQHSAWVSPETAEAYRRTGFQLTGLEAILSGWGSGPYVYASNAEHVRCATRLLETVGASALMHAPLPAMSEGQLRLMLLLRAIAPAPRFLFLDEVFDGLDCAVRSMAMAALEKAIADGAQVLMAAHRADDVPEAIQHVLLLEHGQIVQTGGRELLPAPADTRSGVAHMPFLGPPLWEMHHAAVRLDGMDVLTDISWTVRQGQHWVVSGPNGAGKSTLLRLAAAELHPLPGGSVRRLGRNDGVSLWDVRRAIGFVSLDIQSNYDPDCTVLECVASGFAGTVGLKRPALGHELESAAALLDQMGMAGLGSRRLERLSFGQRRMAVLLRAIVHGPQALLLDEPLTGLDASNRGHVLDLLETLAARGTSLIAISHRPGDLPPYIDMELRLEAGRVVSCGLR